LAWDEARQNLVKKLNALNVPVRVLVITEPGRSPALDPGPLRNEPDRFHVLETGQIEQGLARLT
jgi:hypothetical protein